MEIKRIVPDVMRFFEPKGPGQWVEIEQRQVVELMRGDNKEEMEQLKKDYAEDYKLADRLKFLGAKGGTRNKDEEVEFRKLLRDKLTKGTSVSDNYVRKVVENHRKELRLYRLARAGENPDIEGSSLENPDRLLRLVFLDDVDPTKPTSDPTIEFGTDEISKVPEGESLLAALSGTAPTSSAPTPVATATPSAAVITSTLPRLGGKVDNIADTLAEVEALLRSNRV